MCLKIGFTLKKIYSQGTKNSHLNAEGLEVLRPIFRFLCRRKKLVLRNNKTSPNRQVLIETLRLLWKICSPISKTPQVPPTPTALHHQVLANERPQQATKAQKVLKEAGVACLVKILPKGPALIVAIAPVVAGTVSILVMVLTSRAEI